MLRASRWLPPAIPSPALILPSHLGPQPARHAPQLLSLGSLGDSRIAFCESFINHPVKNPQRHSPSTESILMPSNLTLSFAALFATLLLPGCNRATPEGDLKFIGFQYTAQNSAYVSIDSKKYMGDGYAESLDAAPHLKIHGSWCELTWTENKPDGSKDSKKVCFPTSNIHSFKWKE